MQAYLLVFLGAGIGGALWHGVNVGAARVLGIAFPWGTLTVNVVGGFAMGLIADEHAMSQRNRALQQHRNYDRASLRVDVESAGLRIWEEGGYFLKPFTHAQMEDLTKALGSGIIPGLWQLGREMPDLASEIYVNAAPAP